LVDKNYFLIKKFGLVSKKIFFYFQRKIFFKSYEKNLEIPCYLLIISNFGAYFYDCYLFFSYHFLN